MPRSRRVPRRAPTGDGPALDRAPTGARDSVDVILTEWAVQWPDLAVAPTAVITRLGRVRSHLDARMAEVFDRFDLSGADFAMLAALRRAGPPFTLPQSELMTRLGLTSGTVSVRLSRLEARGVVDRAHPGSGRGVLVTLTDPGIELFDRVAPAHLAHQDVLLSALSPTERDDLARLLRTLLVSFEQELFTSPLGVTVATAHRSRLARRAVGLSDPTGLLVDAVEPGSPAARAGIEPGDLLLEHDGHPLASIVELTEATTAALHAGVALRVEVLRGEYRRTATVGPDA